MCHDMDVVYKPQALSPYVDHVEKLPHAGVARNEGKRCRHQINVR